MTEFGAGAELELTVPDSQLRAVRQDIEDAVGETAVTVEADITRPTTQERSPAMLADGGGAVPDLLDDQNALLEDILDELESGGVGGGDAGGGLSGIVAGGGIAGGLATAGTLGGAALLGGGLGFAGVNLLDQAGGIDATEGAGEGLGNALGPLRQPAAGGLARGLGPFGLAGAAVPGLATGDADRAESDVRSFAGIMAPESPDQTVLDMFGSDGEQDPSSVFGDAGFGESFGEDIFSNNLIDEGLVDRLESLDLLTDEQIRQLEDATAGVSGPDPDDEADLARVGAAQRAAGASREDEVPARIAARAVGSDQQPTGGTREQIQEQTQAIEANVSVSEDISVDANVDDIDREVDKQLDRKLQDLKRDVINELRRQLS